MRRGALALAACCLLAPNAAHAHLNNSGLGPFHDGLAHFVTTPGDVLPAIALALFAGLRGARVGRLMLLALPVAWAMGGLVGLQLAQPIALPWLSAVAIIACGSLVALDRSMPIRFIIPAAALVGFVSGSLNGSELAAGDAGLLPVAGMLTALLVLVAIMAGQAAALRAPWMRIAARVLGSWIAAAGLLILGWSLRGG